MQSFLVCSSLSIPNVTGCHGWTSPVQSFTIEVVQESLPKNWPVVKAKKDRGQRHSGKHGHARIKAPSQCLRGECTPGTRCMQLSGTRSTPTGLLATALNSFRLSEGRCALLTKPIFVACKESAGASMKGLCSSVASMRCL